MRLSGSFSKSCQAVFYFLLLPLVFSAITPEKTYAQANALNVLVTPQTPGPFETVRISVEDYSRDLNKVEITWTVNGTVEKKGIGLKNFETKTGALGSVTNISINMGGLKEPVVLRPSTVDILWQADTFTPVFYKGKALHSNQDPVMMVAEPFFITPQGTRLDPNKLVYKWKHNSVIDNGASGYGKKTFYIQPSILLKPIDIELEVSSTDGLYRSKTNMSVPDSATEVVFYENHPLYGMIFDKALNNQEFEMKSSEISVVGVPYFFSNLQRQIEKLTYEWSLNSSIISRDTDELIFRKPDSASGKSSVGLAIKNLDRFMQTSKANFTVIFNKEAEENSSAIF